MKRIKLIITFLTISQFFYSQPTLEKRLTNSVIKDSIDNMRKYFIEYGDYSDFKKHFQNRADISFVQKKTLRSSNFEIHYFELKSKNYPSDIEKVVFFTETKNDTDLINFFIFGNDYSDSINEIINRNYLSNNFRKLSSFPENQKSQKLDSIEKKLVIMFKENKDTFLLKYFRPEICDNSIGDTWYIRSMENKVEIINVEFIESFYEEKLECGIIKLSTTFSNNDTETDILYYRKINCSYNHFETSLNSDLLRCLK